MEKTLDRPAVDVAPLKAHPGLALLLALLAVPGSTVAWDLPAGGLWIGLPLAIAAIAIGISAHRLLGGSKLAVAAISRRSRNLLTRYGTRALRFCAG